MTRTRWGIFLAAAAGLFLALKEERPEEQPHKLRPTSTRTPFGFWRWMKCRGTHDATRYFLGGHFCRLCGVGLGPTEDQYVRAIRKTFSREHESVVRSSAWPDEKRRGA